MTILCLDSSGIASSIALVDGDAVVPLCSSFSERPAHLESLLELIDAGKRILENDITELRVTVGPGSFTGLRISCGFALGLAAALKLPILGFESLFVAAHAAEAEGRFLVVSDARRAEFFFLLAEKTESKLLILEQGICSSEEFIKKDASALYSLPPRTVEDRECRDLRLEAATLARLSQKDASFFAEGPRYENYKLSYWRDFSAINRSGELQSFSS